MVELAAKRHTTGRRGALTRNGSMPVRIAGLGTATGEQWISSGALADILRNIWPDLDGRLANLLTESPADGRFVSRSPEELARGLSLSEQGPIYTSTALRLARQAAERALAEAGCDRSSIGAVIVVSCTGLVLPGIDARIVEALGLQSDVVRIPLTQLGCGGGAAGLARGAEWVRAGSSRKALVIAVELSSLTFRPADRSVDNLLSALVFSDGAGAVVLDTPAGDIGQPAPSLGRSGTALVPGTTGALGFELVDDGFRVVLSRRLPQLIEESLPPVVERFLGATSPSSLWVIAAHPGGSAILDAVQRSLQLSPRHLAPSRTTFRAFGNSSSAAIFFVLAELQSNPPPAASRGLAIAFGPGLAIELLELMWPN